LVESDEVSTTQKKKIYSRNHLDVSFSEMFHFPIGFW